MNLRFGLTSRASDSDLLPEEWLVFEPLEFVSLRDAVPDDDQRRCVKLRFADRV
jgi:hypothetical protein